MARAVDALESDPPPAAADIGAIAVACALGYLDFRFADEPWRPAHDPRILVRRVSKLPPLARTAPVG